MPDPQARGDGRFSRRSVLRTAAWATPAIAVAAPAPAFAASCTQFYSGTMDWGATTASTWTRASNTSGSGVAQVSGSGTVTVSANSTFTGYSPITTDPLNLSSYSPIGGTGTAGLTFWQFANSAATAGPGGVGSQTIKIDFDRPVYNLAFLITDLDYNAGQFWDAMAVTVGTYTYAVPTGSTVTGSGTATDPFRTSGTAAFDNNSGTGGNVQVKMAGPTSTFTLKYWNYYTAPTATSLQQAAWIAPMTFQVHNAGC